VSKYVFREKYDLRKEFMMASNDDDDNILGISIKQIKNKMERQVLESIVFATPTMTYSQRQQWKAALDVFERHNIGAIEAMEILTEISKVYNE